MILLSLIVLYLGAIVICIVTVNKPAQLLVDLGSTEIVMDGVSKVPLRATVLDNHGNPMSGQEIYFQMIVGSGKVVTLLAVTGEDGKALAEYQVGYGNEESTVKIDVKNMTGLLESVEILERPNLVDLKEICVEADIEQTDILKDGLKITATLLDSQGQPVENGKLLFKVISGSVGFSGLKMMSKTTDDQGTASILYSPAAASNVSIKIEAEADSSVYTTLEFTVK